MDQRIIDLYHHFTHGGMNRRQFLDRLADLVGSTAAAAALLPVLQGDYAKAAIVAPDDHGSRPNACPTIRRGEKSAVTWCGRRIRASGRPCSSSMRTAD